MKFYVVVEGAATEKEVYRSWIPLVNGTLSYVEHPSFLQDQTFTIISGNGYPYYKKIIQDAIADISAMPGETRLVVCVDSEEMNYQDKFNEVSSIISEVVNFNLDYKIVIQHFCFETWALGNRNLKSPSHDISLIEMRRLYDVSKLDPEGLPPYLAKKLNRSQHAHLYLRKLLNNKNKSITYSKNSPQVVCHPKYFKQVKNRLIDTQHIQSFNKFLTAFHD